MRKILPVMPGEDSRSSTPSTTSLTWPARPGEMALTRMP
jgi:hypothetical protein